MYLLIHIATTYQAFRAKSDGLKERIYALAQRSVRQKDPEHPVLWTSLEQYLLDETPHTKKIKRLLKTTMAITPELGHVIAIAQGIAEESCGLTIKTGVAKTIDGERPLLENFWQKLDRLTRHEGVPTFVTWNGLKFTFPFLIERSLALGLTPTIALPRARFQPWRH